MNVILSFATETAFSTRIHDLIKELAHFLTSKGLKGNFHLTGDFARALRKHGRRDVIRALTPHEIGYHCNHHGGRPFMGGYCEQGSWQSGVSTWLNEELPGMRIVEELFDRTPAYYTTEFAKAPQVVYGSWLAGIPSTGILLGQGPDGQTAPLPDGGQGAAWYCNSFVPTGRYLLSVDPEREGFEEVMSHVLAVLSSELSKTSGVLRAFMHEYRLIQDPAKPVIGSTYADTHYENISFDYLPDEVIAANIRRMKTAMNMLADHPGANLISYTDYREEQYYPGHGQWLSLGEVDRVAQKMTETIGAVVLKEGSVSPAESAGLVVRALRTYRETGRWPENIALRSLISPTEECSGTVPACSIPIEDLLDGLTSLDRTLDDENCIPAFIDAGGRMLGPGQWLQCLAQLYLALRAGDTAPGNIECPSDSLPAIAADTFFQQTVFTRPKLYPEGFTGERICRLCKLQSWSWKPAVRRGAGLGR